MGIVKVADSMLVTKSVYSCGNEDLTPEERSLLQTFPGHESDDREHTEVGCELAMSGGLMCNVPYELYDLPELKDILSLETWNLCLTEDDRFRLAAYLPDMNQHDFFTTMNELFSGSDMFFGSPLRGFFDRLNGGFYSPEVSQARELLMMFQRRKHYHFLKMYHDGMIWKFAYMDKLWRKSGTSTSLEEKVHIWHSWIHQKLLTFADPNSSPVNANLSIVGKAEAAGSSLLKRAKLMDVTVTTNYSAKHKEIVHRAESMEMSSSKSHMFHLPNEPSEKCSKLPKGVLKIRTECESLAYGNARIHHAAGLIPLDQLQMQVSSFSPYASAQDVHSFAGNSSYPCHINTSSSTWGNSGSNPLQWQDASETYPVLVKTPLGIQATVLQELGRGSRSGYHTAAKHTLSYSNEENDTRESPHEKNLLKNFGPQNAIIPGSSFGMFPTTIVDHQTRYLDSPTNAEIISEMLTLGTSTNPSYTNFSEQTEYQDGPKMKAPPAMDSVTKVEDHQFPYTYTRRKLHRGLDLVDPVNKPSMVGSGSPSVLASMENVKVKAIRL
ncbi:uncharacterized protein LOC100837593 isoform X1 [Brachypodium distachyon]|uniref:DEUBAD domain-containing protein n=1 Tax=Brachypodium distachyon TaxID=15368 RepID=I1I8B5_BRADI|nr:uncharacterized protein LOC100837593 isoform X1 [Brachypodium distachyon]KQJ98856.1 hypothetical protein BRADI_3g39550v3 [Brachypodium distachyon]|eukprot:XP_003574716.1 uncharacterized protein LOC100837593 isoform X1 [Brachypodium distachyon]